MAAIAEFLNTDPKISWHIHACIYHAYNYNYDDGFSVCNICITYIYIGDLIVIGIVATTSYRSKYIMPIASASYK